MEAARESAPTHHRNWMYWLLTVILVLVFLLAIDLSIGYQTIANGVHAAWVWFNAPSYRTVSETVLVIPARGTKWERIEKAQNFLKDHGTLGRFESMNLVNTDSVRIVLSPAGHPR